MGFSPLKGMPRLVSSREEFERLLPMAKEVRVVRRGGKVKVKARLSRLLYTYVTNEEEANEILKGVKAPIKEF